EGNDLRDTLRFLDHREEQAAGDAGERAGRRRPLAADSYFLNFVAASVEVLAEHFTRPAFDFGYTVAQGGRRIAMNVANADRDEVETARRLLLGEGDLGAVAPPIRTFRELAEAAGFVPILAYLPAAYTAFAPSARFADPDAGAAVAELSRRQRVALAAIAEAAGIAFVDCTGLFQQEAPQGDLAYFPANLHLTRRGHELAADCLGDRLRESL
ncbi:MAG TPA: hypothetical protein VFG43_04880, partial [Geminicoccaceae bacterium]|nr:hypothetical protein [Geminicoccaceae bacterium]